MDRPAGFALFVDANYASVQRALSLALGDPELAADATQEAFAQAMRHWRRLTGMDRPVGWVYVVGVNFAARAQRRRQREPHEVSVPEPDVAGRVVLSVSVRESLAVLPSRQRLAVVLRYLACLSTAETAAAMRCSEGTVKSTLHAALKAMRIELEDNDEG